MNINQLYERYKNNGEFNEDFINQLMKFSLSILSKKNHHIHQLANNYNDIQIIEDYTLYEYATECFINADRTYNSEKGDFSLHYYNYAYYHIFNLKRKQQSTKNNIEDSYDDITNIKDDGIEDEYFNDLNINSVKLTNTQKEIISLLIKGYNPTEISRIRGVRKQAVFTVLKTLSNNQELLKLLKGN